jgi:hypothetical protein
MNVKWASQKSHRAAKILAVANFDHIFDRIRKSPLQHSGFFCASAWDHETSLSSHFYPKNWLFFVWPPWYVSPTIVHRTFFLLHPLYFRNLLSRTQTSRACRRPVFSVDGPSITTVDCLLLLLLLLSWRRWWWWWCVFPAAITACPPSVDLLYWHFWRHIWGFSQKHRTARIS